MALPAGRYGVTKNQLLKIKKLPMNTIKLIEDLYEKYSLLGSAAFKNSTSVVTESSDLVESGAVKELVGWGNKNLLPNNAVNNSINGADFTVNADKSILVNTPVKTTGNVFYTIYNGTLPAGSYVLSGCPSDGGNTGYSIRIGGTDLDVRDYGEGASFTLAQSMNVLVNIVLGGGGNLVVTNKLFKPMIRLASVTDDTYEPYHESVEQTLRDAEVIDGKNLLNPTVASSGIVTRNADNTFTVNGTLSSATLYELGRDCLPTLPIGDYMLSGCPKSGVPDRTTLSIRKSTTSSGTYHDYGNGVVWNVTDAESATAFCYIYLPAGTYNNVVFRPMLEKGTVATTYEPYYIPLKDALPNKCDNSVIGTVEDGTNPTRSYAVGEHFIRNGKFCTVTVAVTTSSTWTLGSNYVEGTIADNLVKQDTFSGTTTETGIVEIYNGNRNVIKCESSGGNRIIQPFYSYSRSKVMARCIYENGSVIENDTVSGTYYYI